MAAKPAAPKPEAGPLAGLAGRRVLALGASLAPLAQGVLAGANFELATVDHLNKTLTKDQIIAKIRALLETAITVELATIPIYLFAYYSINRKPTSNNSAMNPPGPASGEAKPLANRTRENVAAIDGLYQYNGQLIGVENVTNPGRVVLMRLSSTGDEIVEVRTVLSHHHSRLDEPTTGAVRADTGYFYLLSATGVSHFNAQGRIENLDTLPTPTVLKVLLPR